MTFARPRLRRMFWLCLVGLLCKMLFELVLKFDARLLGDIIDDKTRSSG